MIATKFVSLIQSNNNLSIRRTGDNCFISESQQGCYKYHRSKKQSSCSNLRRLKRSESDTHFTSSLSIAVGIHTVLISVSVLNAEDDNAPVVSGYRFTTLTC